MVVFEDALGRWKMGEEARRAPGLGAAEQQAGIDNCVACATCVVKTPDPKYITGAATVGTGPHES